MSPRRPNHPSKAMISTFGVRTNDVSPNSPKIFFNTLFSFAFSFQFNFCCASPSSSSSSSSSSFSFCSSLFRIFYTFCDRLIPYFCFLVYDLIFHSYLRFSLYRSIVSFSLIIFLCSLSCLFL